MGIRSGVATIIITVQAKIHEGFEPLTCVLGTRDEWHTYFYNGLTWSAEAQNKLMNYCKAWDSVTTFYISALIIIFEALIQGTYMSFFLYFCVSITTEADSLGPDNKECKRLCNPDSVYQINVINRTHYLVCSIDWYPYRFCILPSYLFFYKLVQ